VSDAAMNGMGSTVVDQCIEHVSQQFVIASAPHNARLVALSMSHR
jgi:hypothetical protein